MRIGLLCFLTAVFTFSSNHISAQYAVDFRGSTIPVGWTAVDIEATTAAGGYAKFIALGSQLISPAFVVTAGSMVSYSVAKFSSGTDGPITIEVSNDNGMTWTAQTFTSSTPTSSTYINDNFALTVTGEIKIRITRASSPSAKRFRDFEITNASLPVNLTKFTATPTNGTVTLEWATATEQNNRHFSVQRSGDGRVFTEIGEVRGTGNSVTAQNYAYLDRAPLSGMNYYRLEQVDFDGATAVYGPLSVNMRQAAGTKPTVYPNPATNFINISSEMDDDTQVTLVSITGQVISSVQFGWTKTGNVGSIDVSQLKSGVYFLRFENGNDLETVRFVKE